MGTKTRSAGRASFRAPVRPALRGEPSGRPPLAAARRRGAAASFRDQEVTRGDRCHWPACRCRRPVPRARRREAGQIEKFDHSHPPRGRGQQGAQPAPGRPVRPRRAHLPVQGAGHPRRGLRRTTRTPPSTSPSPSSSTSCAGSPTGAASTTGCAPRRRSVRPRHPSTPPRRRWRPPHAGRGSRTVGSPIIAVPETVLAPTSTVDGRGRAAGGPREDPPRRPMTLDQALFEMELVGHDFYLFVRQGDRAAQRRLPAARLRLRRDPARDQRASKRAVTRQTQLGAIRAALDADDVGRHAIIVARAPLRTEAPGSRHPGDRR